MNSPQSIPETFSSLGSWNADATESSIPKGDLLEALNFRKARPDEYETRSGILTKSFPGNKYPGSIAEYRLDNTYVVALFYEESGSLNCKIISNDLSSSAINVDINGIVTGGHGYEVMACQFNTFLLVTVFGYGVFALGPKANLDKDGNPTSDVNLAVSSDLTVWNAPIELGKQLTPTPDALSFSSQVTGDLIIYQYITPPPNTGTDCKGQFDTAGASDEPIKTRVAMNAPYFLVGAGDTNGANLRSTNLVKQFEWEKGSGVNGATGVTDGDPGLPSDRPVSGSDHLQKRGWFYRFLMKSKFKDAKGQDFTYFHEASTDIYVPDNNYAPPFPVRSTGGIAPFAVLTHTISEYPLTGDVRSFYNELLPDGTSGNTDLRTMPDIGATNPFGSDIYKQFIAAYKAFFHDTTADKVYDTNPDTQDPYYFTAAILGYQIFAHGGGSVPSEVFWYMLPYKVSVPVSELLSGPQTIIKWADFGTLPDDVFEIDVYRTAYVDNANFEAQTYGKAGSITKDGTFTDNIKDTDLVFDDEIRAESGYLKGEFSGKVIRVWNGNIREGDVQTAYQIHKPSKLVQHFYSNSGRSVGIVSKTHLQTVAPDALKEWNYAYQYVDDDGNVSDLSVLDDVTFAENSNDDSGCIGFTFPHGYGSKVTKIYLFEGRWLTTPTAHREYRRVAEIPVVDGHLVYTGKFDFDWVTLPIAEDSKPKISHDPGACVWSEAQDMFFFPQINFELEHQFAPVTKIGVTVGPAHILTDQTVNKTDFGIDNRWEEVSSGQDSVGCIGRFCSLELGKAIIFLSAKGLYLAEGSGIRPFPAYVQTVVLKYLNEHITGVAPLANARRAGMGWLGQRNEMWLSFPSSYDFWYNSGIAQGKNPTDADIYAKANDLPPITIVYRFFDDFGYFGKKDAGNYRFFLTDTDAVNDVQHQVFYLGSATGKMFAVTFDDRTSPQMLLIDCDNSSVSDWKLPGYLTLPMTLGAPHVVKDLDALRFLADAQCKLQSVTGMRRTDGSDLPITQGLLHASCTTFDHTIDPAEKFLQPFNHQISESIFDFKDRVPLLRIISKPDDSGNHKCRIKSVEAEFYVPDVRNIHTANMELRYYGRWEPIGSQTPEKETNAFDS